MTRRPVRRGAGCQSASSDGKPGLASRQAASRLLAAVVDAQTSLDGLTDDGHGHPQYLALSDRDRALVRAILLAALRRRVTLDRIVSELLDRPLPANARSLRHLLHVGAVQILFLDVPDSAAVDLAVAQAKADPRAARFSGLVNAVLRAIAAQKETLLLRHAGTVDAPDWLVERLSTQYGDDRAGSILRMTQHEAPMDFTVKSGPEAWAERLGGIVLPTGSVRVARMEASVAELPGYAEGAWWVQDAASALPARLFRAPRGQRIADLCAAPGGKTAQLANAGAQVTALDISANRLTRLRANLERLGLEAEIVTADLRGYQPAEPFDAVLLDAPCSSTGTLRRHPDVAWTKSAGEIAKLAAVQRDLLDHAARLVRPGGTIVFSNCSLDRQEGEDLVEGFLGNHPELARDPVETGEIAGADAFIRADGSLRTLPDGFAAAEPALAGLDGFYAVRLVRAS